MIALWLTLAQTLPGYGEHVAPILHEHCAPCHRPGEAAPFPLLTYDDARNHARQIALVTKQRYMPPWPPSPGHGDFAGERRLTRQQIATLAQWAEAGAPAGGPAPAPPAFVTGWQLGEPDLVVKMRRPYALAASGGDVFRNFVLPVELNETRWVRAIELRPGNPRVVHHANVVVDRTRSLRARDGQDGQPGFAGMDVETESGDEFEPDSHFLFWKPGTAAAPEPEGMPWRLDPGTDLVANLHLQPSGKPEKVEVVLGLYFDKRPAQRFPILAQLEHDGAIDIPAGASNFVIADALKLPVDCEVFAIYPHAHYTGKRIEAWATRPDGTRVSLLLIEDWDINWQASYTYRVPVLLPAGTTVSMRIAYDNSAANPRNPARPPVRVKAGDRSRDEMGHVWLQLLPRRAEDRLAIHEAVMRRRLEKYPADFLAHYNLAAALQTTGRNRDALPLLVNALKLRPASAPARNALAGGLLVEGRIAEAARHLRELLRAQPSYAPARFNLGRALAAQGDGDGAVREWTLYLQSRPDDGQAHYQLAGVQAGAQRLTLALPHLRRAAALLPNVAEVHANLGVVLSMTGDREGALLALERAAVLDPGNGEIERNLARLRSAQK